MPQAQQLVRYLLGDTGRGQLESVAHWLHSLEQITDFSQLARGSGDPSILFELGCAQLFDSRLEAARLTFQGLSQRVDESTPQILAIAGLGRTENALRNFNGAHQWYEQAIDLAREKGHNLLIYISTLLQRLNLSDWNCAVDMDSMPALTPSDASDTRIRFLVEAYVALVRAKVHFRCGHRSEGLAVLEPIVSSAEFDDMAGIPQGGLLRMQGILFAISGRAPAAQAQFVRAVTLYRRVEYHLGEVQAALSLARVTSSANRRLTLRYLTRALAILEQTDRVRHPTPHGRQMPGEYADIWSRLGDEQFARGDFQGALKLYEKDQETLCSLDGFASNESAAATGHPRSLGYVERNLGRTKLALGEFQNAANHLRRSCELFQSVADEINAFISGVILVDALFEDSKPLAAKAVVEELDKLIAERVDRDKENAIVETLRALVILRTSSRTTAALPIVTSAHMSLHTARDIHYVRSALVEAEALHRIQDYARMRRCLDQAVRCASDNARADIHLMVSRAHARLGIPQRKDGEHPTSTLIAEVKENGFTGLSAVVLFADIRGFTSASSRVATESMAVFISEFAELVARCVRRYGGLPVRFLGDCVVAVFEVNETSTSPEVAALTAACHIHGLFSELRSQIATEPTPDIASLGIGFGIAMGNVIAGVFGADDLSEFSVIGEPVNLASRLQGETADGEIAVCSAVARRIKATKSLRSLRLESRSVALKGLDVQDAFWVDVGEAISHLGRRSSHPVGVRQQSQVPPDQWNHTALSSRVSTFGSEAETGVSLRNPSPPPIPNYNTSTAASLERLDWDGPSQTEFDEPIATSRSAALKWEK